MIVLTVPPEAIAADVLTAVKVIAKLHPGRKRLQIIVLSPPGGGEGRAVRLGWEWRYDGSAACLAALREFGRVEVVDG